MSERKTGFYWVKWDNETCDPSWCPSWWCVDEEAWWVEECYQRDGDVVEIGPRIPTPDEPWQCVPVEANADMLDVLTLGNLVTASRRWRDTLKAAPKPGEEQ